MPTRSGRPAGAMQWRQALVPRGARPLDNDQGTAPRSVAATGGRMVLSTLRELSKRGGQHALLTICAAGGLGVAVVLEAA